MNWLTNNDPKQGWFGVFLAWIGTTFGDALNGLTLQKVALTVTIAYTLLQCVISLAKIIARSRTKNGLWSDATDRTPL